jgi:hypothetical protein
VIDYQCVARKKWCRNRADDVVMFLGRGERERGAIAQFWRMALILK